MPDVGFTRSEFFSGYAMSMASGQVTASGNTALVTPAIGATLHIHYCSYNPRGATEAGFRWGTTGTIFLRNDVAANSVIAKDFGETRYISGKPDESLYLNQSADTTVNWTVFYTEH